MGLLMSHETENGALADKTRLFL